MKIGTSGALFLDNCLHSTTQAIQIMFILAANCHKESPCTMNAWLFRLQIYTHLFKAGNEEKTGDVLGRLKTAVK